MDEDGTDNAALCWQRADKRAAATAKDKGGAVKNKGKCGANVKGNKSNAGKGGASGRKKGEEIVVEVVSDEEDTVNSGNGRANSRSRSRSCTRVDEDEATVRSDGGGEKSRSRSRSCSLSRSRVCKRG
jgi:hypothetical protein